LQPHAAHLPHSSHLGSHTPADPPHPRTEPGVALRHGQVQPVLQHWPAGVPRALASRYKDLQILGQGGHGVVYRARDTALDRYVVLKLMMQSTLGTEMARRYFQREVRLAASLNHANIVHIYDVGEAEGVLWYAMEFVDGVPLAQYLQPGKPLPDMSFIYSVFSQLCEALDHAHSQGILHRDVKPDNVLVAADGTVKLFDFGLARGADQGFGEQSLLLGTPYYMAPEQLSGGKVTHATDAYALGVLLYRLLAGEVPFHKGNVFAAHVLEPVPDPRKLQRGIPDGAVAVVMRLLAKRGEDRYPDCRQAAVELWQACFG
jgi:serine/threonine-protein kinase